MNLQFLVVHSVHYLGEALRFIEPYSINGSISPIASSSFADERNLLVVYLVYYLAAALRFIELYSINGNMTSIALVVVVVD